MKICILCFSFFTFIYLRAADVRWNCFDSYSYSHQGSRSYTFEYLGYLEDGIPQVITPSIDIIVARDKNNIILDGENSFALSIACVWVEKYYNDLINFETMYGQKDYFAASVEHRPQEDDFDGGVVITVQPDSTIYLAVMESFFSQSENPDAQYYGWLELYVDSNGELELKNSAFAVDGSPLFVGGGSAIPEPTSAMLICLGLMGLALKRRF